MKKRVLIQSSVEGFYKKVLLVMKCGEPIKSLRPKEMQLLAYIMKRSDELNHLDRVERYSLIFSKEEKAIMMNELDQSLASLNNNISILKNKRLLDKNKMLTPALEGVGLDDDFSVEFLIKKHD